MQIRLGSRSVRREIIRLCSSINDSEKRNNEKETITTQGTRHHEQTLNNPCNDRSVY